MLKIVAILDILRTANPAVTLVMNIFLDALGRNQVWKMLFKRLKSLRQGGGCMNGGGVGGTWSIGQLAQIALCSELDMDYFTVMLVVMVNLVRSPIRNLFFAIYHVQDGKMTLSGDSLLNQSVSSLAALSAVILLGDFATFLGAKLLRKYQLYQIRYIFSENTPLTCICSLVFASSSLSAALAFAYILNA